MDLQELMGSSIAQTNTLVQQVSSKKKANVFDQWTDYKGWLRLWKHMLHLTVTQPKEVSDAYMDYPWMPQSMKGIKKSKNFDMGRGGEALKMSYVIDDTLFGQMTGQDQAWLFCDPEHTVLYNILIPNQILRAMHVQNYMLESPANMLSLLDQNSVHPYFDLLYSLGLPQDTCTYASLSPGIVLNGEFEIGKRCPCLIASNRACEGASASWAPVVEALGDIPTYRMDVPENFSTDPAVLDDFVTDIKGMIKFVSKYTDAQMDWDELRHICENMNKITRMQAEMWELNRGPDPVACGDITWLASMLFYNMNPGTDVGVEAFSELLKLAKVAHEKGECSVPNLKYRAILWNPPTFMYGNFWNWLERCWGVGIVMDMETFHDPVIIDTRTPDSMLQGIATTWCFAPMARHNRGQAENTLNGLSELKRLYRPDFVLDMNHMACRASVGLSGALKEWSQANDTPICFADYDMFDNRVVSRQEIRDQINRFMQDVMHATPLDPSLLNFDDSNVW